MLINLFFYRFFSTFFKNRVECPFKTYDSKVFNKQYFSLKKQQTNAYRRAMGYEAIRDQSRAVKERFNRLWCLVREEKFCLNVILF